MRKDLKKKKRHLAVLRNQPRVNDKDSKMLTDYISKTKLNPLPNETVEVDDNYNIIINFEIVKV